MENLKNRKKRKFSFLSVLFYLTLLLGVVWILAGVVFWFLLAFVLKQGYDNLDSSKYSVYYYLSIVAVTIGIGNITIGFSIRGSQNRKTDKSDDLKNNTLEALESYNAITGSSDALFVKEVLSDFAEEWSLDAIGPTFVDDPNTYYDKYYQLITTPKAPASSNTTLPSNKYNFVDSLVNYCKNYDFYLKDKPKDDTEYLMYFVKACAKLLKQFEPICYQYCNDRVTKRIFELDILHGIKEFLLRGYIVVNYYNLESDLTYLRVSLLKEKNKANILLEEV